MLSEIPTNKDKVSKEMTDWEILRWATMAELDAINLYEQMAVKAHNPLVKKILLDVAKEEKEHIGEFESLLFELDKEQIERYEKGKSEVEEMKNK